MVTLAEQPSETRIEIQFDKFLENLKFNDYYISDDLRYALGEFEEQIKSVMAEVETELYDTHYHEGYAEGQVIGHDEGYDQCRYDHDIDV